MPSLSILIVAPEAQPFAKTGGLADVVGSLASALGRLGHEVTLVLPRYRGVEPTAKVEQLRTLQVGRRAFTVGHVVRQLGRGVRVILLDCPDLYDREYLYGVGNVDYDDNAIRFAVLARGALEWAAGDARAPHVIHAHDWQGGLVPAYLATRYRANIDLAGAGTVFTIHNLAYPGLFPGATLPELDLGWELFTIDGLEYWGNVSFLKAGIIYSDAVTTVSPRYAREVLTPEFGFGFDGILARRKDVLTGILNGIDTNEWNPAADSYLPAPFTADDLAGKQAAKRELLRRFGLPVGPDAMRRPLVGMISRLVDQKGFDLLAQLRDDLPRLDATFILIGSGEATYERFWQDLAARHPDRIGAWIDFDEERAHLVEAGADVFLMPSRFEPCGLNQMYSLRYGTVPVVRAVGGLDDTVQAYNPRTGSGNGFKFTEYSAGALLLALEDALEVFGRPAEWRTLQRAGMRADHSWDVSARAYVKVYRQAIRVHRSTPGKPGASADKLRRGRGAENERKSRL